MGRKEKGERRKEKEDDYLICIEVIKK